MSAYELHSVREDLVEWSQPLIIDQINRFYFHRLAHDTTEARELAIQHYRVWRHVLREDMEEATRLRAGLAARAARSNLYASALDEADRAVLDELMDVVVCRFRRTPQVARSYGVTLLDTATSLARTRVALA